MRLIDADALMEKIDAWDDSARNGENPNCKNGNEYEAAMDIAIMVEQAPTIDATPVVRCRECAVPHNEKTGCPKLLGVVTMPDFFCGFGERGDNHDK